MIPSAPLGTDAAAGRPRGLGAAAGAGPDQAAAERRFRFELATHPGSPAQARRLVRARLSGWSVCEDTCDTAALVVSELVTNAIVHTASEVVVCELHDGDEHVRLSVRDEGCAPGEPHPSPQRPKEEHGRGLLLVEALCQSWGAQEHGLGLLVWADLPRNAEAVAEPVEGVADLALELREAPAPCEPRDDLGWGARPEPAPSDDTGEEDEPTEQTCRAVHPVAETKVEADLTAISPPGHQAPQHHAPQHQAIRTAPHRAPTAEPTAQPTPEAEPAPRRAPETAAHPHRAPAAEPNPQRSPEADAPAPHLAPQRHRGGPEQAQHGPEHAQHGPEQAQHGPDDQQTARQLTPVQQTPRQSTSDQQTPRQQTPHPPAPHPPAPRPPAPRQQPPDQRTAASPSPSSTPERRSTDHHGPDQFTPGLHGPDHCALGRHAPRHHGPEHHCAPVPERVPVSGSMPVPDCVPVPGGAAPAVATTHDSRDHQTPLVALSHRTAPTGPPAPTGKGLGPIGPQPRLTGAVAPGPFEGVRERGRT